MKIILKYSRYILCLLFLLSSFSMASQNPLQPEPSPELEEAARQTAEYWQNELALSTKQTNLFKRKVVEFAMRRNEILNSNLPEEEKSQSLQELRLLEDGDIRDILTKPQYERYLRNRGFRDNNQNPARNDTIQ